MTGEKKPAKSGKVDQIRALRERQAEEREAKIKRARNALVRMPITVEHHGDKVEATFGMPSIVKARKGKR